MHTAVNPATNEEIARVQWGNGDDYERCLENMQEAKRDWVGRPLLHPTHPCFGPRTGKGRAVVAGRAALLSSELHASCSMDVCIYRYIYI